MVSIPKVSAPSGNIAQAGVNPVPSQTGQPIGRGLQQVGNQLNQFANEVHATHLKADRLKARQAEQKFLTAAEKELSDLDPLAEGYSEAAEQVINNARDQALEETEFRTNDGRANFQAKLEAQGEVLARATFRQRNAALEDQALRNLQEDQQQLLADIAEDPANAQLYQDEFNARIAETYAGVVPQSQLEEAALRTAEQAVLAEAQGLAEAGNHKAARAVLDENRGDLDPSQFRAGKRAVRAIQNQQRADFARATASEVADLDIQINGAETLEEVEAARAALAQADARGIFNGRQGTRARLTKTLNARQNAFEQDQRATDQAMADYQAGFGVEDQKSADRVWAELNKDADPQQTMNRLGSFVDETGHVPTSVQDTIARAEETRNPQLLASAAAMLGTIEGRRPGVAAELMEDHPAVARTLDESRALQGAVENPIAAAAGRVANETPADRATRNARGEQFDNDIAPDVNFDDVAKAAGVTGTFGGGLGDQVPPHVREQFMRAYRAAYLRTGDETKAKQLALRGLSNRFGPSRVGTGTGTGAGGDGQRFAEFPPERFMFRPNEMTGKEAAAVIRDDLDRSLEAEGVEVPEGASVRLRPDAQTRADIRAGRPPSYRVVIEDPTIGPHDAQRSDGEPVYYIPPQSLEEAMAVPTFAQLQNESEKEAAKRRQREKEAEATKNRQTRPGAQETPEEAEQRRDEEEAQQQQADEEADAIQQEVERIEEEALQRAEEEDQRIAEEDAEPEEPEEEDQPTGAAGRRARRNNR